MKTSIEVKDRAEAAAIQAALQDPETRAFVVIVGNLLPHTRRTQKRILDFVTDSLDEDKLKRISEAAKDSWT